MDEDGKVAAKEEVVAEQDDEALVEGTKEGQWQANPRYTTTTNTPTKRPARFTCWESTRRLKSNHPKAKDSEGSHTHVCTEKGYLYF